jgi:hypothetical protein
VLEREPEPRADVLALQRTVGNRAVAAMLARVPTEEKAATMTAGLGDDIGVIPIDSFSWGGTHNPGNASGTARPEVHEVTISFGLNAATAAIAQAVTQGKPIASAFVSTQKMTIDFTDVVLTNYLQADHGISVTLNFAGMKLRE